MTIEEKRKAIERYCSTQEKCIDCPLFGPTWCFSTLATDHQIKENYETVFGKEQTTDDINHPAHYTSGKHECIDVMVSMFGVEAVKDFCKCNIFKYRFRAGLKPGESAEKDISKAEWYEDKLIELERGLT